MSLLAFIALVDTSARTAYAQTPRPYESVVEKFEAQDRENPPEFGGIVFIGSSSIRLWDLKESFPSLPVLNRGFGGSHASDVAHYAQRLVVKYRPRTVVFYAGDNDLAAGKSPEKVRADVQKFVDIVRMELPQTRIILLAVKHSPARRKLFDQQRQVNDWMSELSKKDELIKYVDVATPLLGADGVPRKELFLPDQLHLGTKGYAIWTELLKGELE